MRILVTGGAGFIGSNFIRQMLAEHPEHEVLNLDSLTYAGNLENLQGLETEPRYAFVRGDICDQDLLKGLTFDAIIHFAAESHVDRSILDSSPFLQTNITGTKNLLELARARRCRMLHVSTDEVYGSIAEGQFTEMSPLSPNSPYAASKASSDLFARAYHETYGVDVVITRCSNNYGPYQFPEKLIPLMIANALAGKSLPVYGDGKNVRDWIHVADHCRAVALAFHKGRAGEVYNIGGRNEQQNIGIIRMILETISERLGSDREALMGLITYVTDRPGHDRRYAIDPLKTESELGWKPLVGFEEGIASTVDWYLANRAWWGRILSGEYMTYYETQYRQRLGS
ncbi:MAG: dTDP-glucose 4,6-dehydratase [Nitrospirae bacterium]|nr:MAG: dTDP-glucose 4,6-dehydratase [Nitrospirota bacterium]